MKIQLEAKGQNEEMVLAYLEENASEVLVEKINNGVRIEKDGKTLINKKNLTGFMSYALEEARKMAEKGARGTFVKNEVVYGWAIHYFEEDSIEGTLYNEDGTKYEKPKPVVETKKKTDKKAKSSKPLIPLAKKDMNETKEVSETTNKDKSQMTLFDFAVKEEKEEEPLVSTVSPVQEEVKAETDSEEEYEVYDGDIPEGMDYEIEEESEKQEKNCETVESETDDSFDYEIDDSLLDEQPVVLATEQEDEKHWISETEYVDKDGVLHNVEEEKALEKDKEEAKAFDKDALVILDDIFGDLLMVGVGV